jgi:hypothetical protein
MPQDENRHDTKEHIFRKVVKNIDFLAAPANQNLFVPRPGEQFAVLDAFFRVRKTAGVETDPADFQIDNGTDGQDIVATTTTVSSAVNAFKRLTVAGNNIITQDKPLRLRYTDAAGGLTELKGDLIFNLMKLSEVA